MNKEDNEDFKNSTKSWICDNDYVDNGVKVRYCHITGQYRCSAHRDYNINLILNEKITVDKLGIFNLKINVIPNELENYMSFTITNKLTFIDGLWELIRRNSYLNNYLEKAFLSSMLF